MHHRPEGRELPSAAFVAEDPAVGAVTEDSGTDQDRHESCRDQPGLKADDQCETAANFGEDGEISKDGRQAEAIKVANCPGDGENKNLQQAVGDKERACGDPEEEGCVI